MSQISYYEAELNMRNIHRDTSVKELRESVESLTRLIGSAACPECRHNYSERFYTEGLELWPLNITAMREMIREREF